MKKNAGWLALKVALIYFFAAGAWIFFSDLLLGSMVSNQGQLVEYSMVKGLLFLVITSGILYLIIRHKSERLESATAERQAFEQRYRKLFENMNEGVAYCRMVYVAGQPVDFIYLAVNAQFTVLTGLKDVVGKPVTEVIPGLRTSDPEILEIYGRVTRTGQPEKFERYIHALEMWFAVSVFCPEPEHFVAVFNVVTQQKLEQAALQESEERYRALFDRSLDSVFLNDLAGNFLDANQAALNLLGYQREEISSLNFASLLSPDQLPLAFQAISEIVSTGQQKHPLEFRLRRKDGGQVQVEIQSSLIYRDSQPYAIQGIARDITKRKLAEESYARLATAVEQSAESIVMTDPAGTIQYINPAFEKTSGYSRAEVLGRNASVLKSGKQDDEFYRQMWATITRGNVWRGHFINRHKDGTLYEEDVTISPVHDRAGKIVNYVAVKRDLSREVELQSQVRQSQKMDAIGQLAGGVAHDFNNILAVIQLQAGMLKADPSLKVKQREYAKDIEDATNRAAALTRQLLLFSRKQAMQLQDHDLNEVVTSITKMLERVLGENIKMQFTQRAHALTVHADSSMIDQVLMNFTVNARDAMPTGGQLFIETSALDLNEAQAAQLPSARPGSFACLTVRDTGCGMTPKILSRIYEPFFTTKEQGKGTGLGLATVFGIVQQHQGWIHVTSQVGEGTTFRIYLPRRMAPPDNPAEWAALDSILRGHETILLVEDDASLRVSASSSLTRHGYRVLAAATGAEAVVLWESHQNEIKLLLTDLLMPGGMNGKELARKILAVDPALKVIYMSGYSAELVGGDFRLEEGINFLTKPFSVHKLAQIVRDTLDKK